MNPWLIGLGLFDIAALLAFGLLIAGSNYDRPPSGAGQQRAKNAPPPRTISSRQVPTAPSPRPPKGGGGVTPSRPCP